MSQAIQIIGVKHNQEISTAVLKLWTQNLKKAAIFVGASVLKGLKKVWEYLKEQNRLAEEHHRALQMAKDEFYAKNYWCIR